MISYDSSLTFAEGEPTEVALEGFWPVEEGFAWTRGKWCQITFPFDTYGATDRADLIIDMDVFHPGESGQNVFFYLNGLRIGSKYVLGRVTLVLNFPSAALMAEDNVLTIDTPDVVRPADFGIEDDRQLAAQIFSVQIRRC